MVDGFDPLAFVNRRNVEAIWSAQYRYWAAHMQQWTGVWRDLVIHRRVTEIEHIIGPLIERGAKHHVAVPMLRRLQAEIQEAQAGKRSLFFSDRQVHTRVARPPSLPPVPRIAVQID